MEDEIQYRTFIDSSEIISDYYAQQSSFKIEQYVLNIEDWVQKPTKDKNSNTPLLINSDKFQLTQMLLTQWMQYHKKNDKKKHKDMIVTHFTRSSDKNSNIFFAIYNILCQLRENNKIDLKVELIEQKLRKYFGYWLDACCSFIDQQIVNDSKIIIIIDGIDYLKDIQTKKDAITAFWMPHPIPQRIKFIISSYGKNDAMDHFQKFDCQKIEIQDSQLNVNHISDIYINQRKSYITPELKEKNLSYLKIFNKDLLQNSEFIKLYITTIITYESQFDTILNQQQLNDIQNLCSQHNPEKMKHIQTVEQLYQYIIEFFIQNFSKPEKVKKLFLTFNVIQKGLDRKDLLEISEMTNHEFDLFQVFFKFAIFQSKKFLQCINYQMKQIVWKILKPDINYIKNLHIQIATILENRPVTFVTLEEQIYHLNQSKQYFKLKEKMSNCENFLLMYNAYFKYDLCRYWQILEEKGFDPVTEYNKSVEIFENCYKLKSDQLFHIIIQLSRFLKDFCDFETALTPDFRHPPIKGGNELEEIGLLQELKNLEINYDDSQENPVQVLKGVEGLNIEIPQNKETVREFYKNQIRQRMIKDDLQDENDAANNLINDLENNNCEQQKLNNDDEVEYERTNELNRSTVVKKIDKKSDKKYLQGIPLKPESEINTKDPTYYYYKRWVWLIFPWACMIQKDSCNFSKIMKKSNQSNTKSMNVSEEKQAELQTLIIILDAKLKKKLMYCSETQLSFEIKTLNSLKKELQDLNLELGKNQEFDKNQEQKDGQLQDQNDDNKKKKKKLKQIVGNYQNQPVISKTERENNQRGNNMFFTEIDPMDQSLDSKHKNKFHMLPQLSSKSMVHSSMQDGTTFQTSRINDRYLVNQSIDKIMKKQVGTVSLALPKLKENLRNHSQNQLANLISLNKEHKNKLNNLCCINQQLYMKLEHYQKLKDNGQSQEKNEDLQVQAQQKIKELEKKNIQLDNTVEQNEKQISHMNKILLICKQNEKQNQEWIKSLNFFMTSQQKLVKHEIQYINQNKDKIKLLDKMSEKFQQEYANSLQMHDQFVNQIKKTFKDKNRFDQQVEKTNQIIDQSVNEAKNKKFDVSLIGNKNQDIDQQKKLELQKRQSLMKDEIEYQQLHLITQIRELSELLKVDVMKTDFRLSTEFKNFEGNVEKKKELEAIINQLIDKKKSLQKSIKIFKNKKNYIEQAHNQADNKETHEMDNPESQIDLQYLFKKRQELQKNIRDSFKLNIELQKNVQNTRQQIQNGRINFKNMIQSTFDQENQYNIQQIFDFKSDEFVKNLKDKVDFIYSKIGQQKFQEILKDKNNFGEFEILYTPLQSKSLHEDQEQKYEQEQEQLEQEQQLEEQEKQ